MKKISNKNLWMMMTFLMVVSSACSFRSADSKKNFLTNRSVAGGEGANGGDSIVCYDRPLYRVNSDGSHTIDRDAKIEDAYLKDYWEYSQLMKYKLSLSEGSTYFQKVQAVMNRLSQIDPERAKRISNKLAKFDDIFAFLNRTQIPELNDANMVFIPSQKDNCYDTQLAIQVKNRKFRERYVLVDNFIFNKLSEEHKAGLILHELFYEEEISLAGKTNSDDVRKFNFLISSNYMEDVSVEDYMYNILNLSMTYGSSIFNLEGHQVDLDLKAQNDGSFQSDELLVNDSFITLYGKGSKFKKKNGKLVLIDWVAPKVLAEKDIEIAFKSKPGISYLFKNTASFRVVDHNVSFTPKKDALVSLEINKDGETIATLSGVTGEFDVDRAIITASSLIANDLKAQARKITVTFDKTGSSIKSFLIDQLKELHRSDLVLIGIPNIYSTQQLDCTPNSDKDTIFYCKILYSKQHDMGKIVISGRDYIMNYCIDSGCAFEADIRDGKTISFAGLYSKTLVRDLVYTGPGFIFNSDGRFDNEKTLRSVMQGQTLVFSANQELVQGTNGAVIKGCLTYRGINGELWKLSFKNPKGKTVTISPFSKIACLTFNEKHELIDHSYRKFE